MADAHTVPLATFPVGWQTGEPLAHAVVPVLHKVLGVHAAPSVQATQVPDEHTRFVPQEVPLARFVPESVQVGGSVAHESVPV